MFISLPSFLLSFGKVVLLGILEKWNFLEFAGIFINHIVLQFFIEFFNQTYSII